MLTCTSCTFIWRTILVIKNILHLVIISSQIDFSCRYMDTIYYIYRILFFMYTTYTTKHKYDTIIDRLSLTSDCKGSFLLWKLLLWLYTHILIIIERPFAIHTHVLQRVGVFSIPRGMRETLSKPTYKVRICLLLLWLLNKTSIFYN